MMPIPGGSLGGYFDNAALMGAFSLKHRRHTLHAAIHEADSASTEGEQDPVAIAHAKP